MLKRLSQYRYFLLVLSGLAFVMYMDNWVVTSQVFIGSLLVMTLFNLRHTAALHLCIGMLVIKVVEYLIYSQTPTSPIDGEPFVWVNNRIYATNFIIDIFMFLFIAYRPEISNRYLPWLRFSKTPQDLNTIHTEIALLFLVRIYLILIAATLLENLIRNLEHLGFSEEFANIFWEWTWMYHLYEPVKRVLNAFELMLILSTTLTFTRRIRNQKMEKQEKSEMMEREQLSVEAQH